MFLCQNFIPTNGVLLLSNKFKNRTTESQKSSKSFDIKTSVVYIPISLAYQDLQDLTPFNVTLYIYIYLFIYLYKNYNSNSCFTHEILHFVCETAI